LHFKDKTPGRDPAVITPTKVHNKKDIVEEMVPAQLSMRRAHDNYDSK